MRHAVWIPALLLTLALALSPASAAADADYDVLTLPKPSPQSEDNPISALNADVERTLRATGAVYVSQITDAGALELVIQDGTGSLPQVAEALAALQARWPELVVTHEAAAPGARAPSPADTGAPFPTAEALYAHWEEHGYPDQVGGVWSTDGSMERLTVAVVDGDEAAIEAIKAQVADPSLLTFVPCRYSHRELSEVLAAVVADMEGGERCLLSAGLGNRNDDFSLAGEPCVKVLITTLEEGAQAYARALETRYGARVEVELGEFTLAFTEELSAGKPPRQAAPPWLILFALAAGALLLLSLFRRRFGALRTADGAVVSAGFRPTRAQAAQALRRSTVRPDRANWHALQQKLGLN